MKKIFFPLIILCLVISCTKERFEPAIKQNDANQSRINQNNLHRTGVILDNPDSAKKVSYYTPGLTTNKAAILPSIDLSSNMPAVGDQGGESSCVGWAVGYYCKTYQEVVEKNWNNNNNAFSPSWIYNQINGGRDRGSSLFDALNYMVYRGCDFKDNFPYIVHDTLTKPNPGSMSNAAHYKSASWQYVHKSAGDFKSILASSQVLIIAIPVHPDFDKLSSSNPVYDDWSDSIRGYHALCVVGYDDARQAIKVVNSWGTGWGINGYGWIPYNKIPSISEAYVLTDKENAYETNYLTGDFNGDGIADVFTTNGYGWYVSWGGVSGLKLLNTAGTLANKLEIGDFNGDGRSDIFYPDGTNWKVSYSGTGKWTIINSSGVDISTIKIGDFNGDGKDDIFHINNGTWEVSYSGTGKWAIINTGNVLMNNIELGDFNHDKKADVFYPDGANWKVSYGGNTRWTIINTSSETASDLKLGDFNGDGYADVFYATGSEWRVSYGGLTRWAVINTSGVTTSTLTLDDFNNDGISDVFHAVNSGWKISWSGTSKWQIL